MNKTKTALSTFLVYLLVGCNAGSGDGLNSQGQPIATPTPNTPADQPSTDEPAVDTPETEQPTAEEPIDDGSIKPTLSSIQNNVFTPICSVCHGGANPAAGQNLSTLENTIANIINVDSSNPLFKRVQPGNAAQSYLYLKIIGDSQAGAQMPLGQQALEQNTMNAIRTWINDGALIPEQSQALPTVAPKVTQMSAPTNTPVSSEVFLTANAANTRSPSIDFLFNKPMNLGTFNQNEILITAYNHLNKQYANTWLLPNNHYEVEIVNDHQLQIRFNRLDTNIASLTIELNNPSVSTITSTSGQTLDGDVDGFSGGVFIYELSF